MHKVKIDIDLGDLTRPMYNKVHNWCESIFGKYEWHHQPSYGSRGKYWISLTEQQYTLFLLHWGNLGWHNRRYLIS